MELKDYTTEELKAELKRRVEEKKAQKAEEMKNALRCRNCKHIVLANNSKWPAADTCAIRTWGEKYPRHYWVSPSQKACDKFERKTE